MSQTPAPSKLRYELLGVGLITVIGAFLRFWELDSKGLWYDEFCAWYSFASGELLKTLKDVPDVHSPAFALLMMMLRKFFPMMDDYSVRILPASLGVTGVPILFFLGKRLFNARVGLLAAFILAIAPIHIELSRQVLMYSLTLNCILATAFFMYLATETGAIKHWCLASFFITCTLYSHPFGVFPVALITLALAFDSCVLDRAWRRIVAFISVWLAASLAFAPWLTYRIRIGKFSDTLYGTKIAKSESMGAYDRFRKIASWIWQGDNSAGTLPLPLCLLIIFLLVAAALYFRKKRRELLLIAVWSLTPLTVYAACEFYKSPAFPRYAMPAIPPIALLLSVGFFNLLAFTKGAPGLRYPVLVAATLGLGCLVTWNATVLSSQFIAPQLPGFRSVLRLIEAEAQDNVNVLTIAFESYGSHVTLNVVNRYAPSVESRFFLETRDRPYAFTEDLLNRGKIVWYVVSTRLPEKTREWLRTKKNVYAHEVGGYPIYAVLLIPDGAFADPAARNRYLEHIDAASVAAYQPYPVHALLRLAAGEEMHHGPNCVQARRYYEEALRSMAFIRRVAPFSSSAHWIAADILAKLERYDEAQREYSVAASLEFGADYEKLQRSRVSAAQMAEKQRNLNKPKS
ncbi:MAG: glycosyltransferase family 39 protein [Candidatus Hydrogenedentes bacterium]|nr:glycosyltransferase family 39 protein [Candidatus Hydrogenedentota bacterium]